MIYPILKIPNKKLREKCEPIEKIDKKSIVGDNPSIEKDQNVVLDLGPRTSTATAKMHSSIVSRLDQAATEIKVPILKMPCGAGHDAATFANLGVPTGMLFLRNENGSHNPDEYMNLSDFSDGAKLLMRFCMQPPDIAK